MPRNREHRQAGLPGRAGKTARHSAALQASKNPGQCSALGSSYLVGLTRPLWSFPDGVRGQHQMRSSGKTQRSMAGRCSAVRLGAVIRLSGVRPPGCRYQARLRLGTCSLVDTAMAPITCSHGYLYALKIWIDDALGRAARCRQGALRHRGIAAFDVAPIYAVGLQADGIVRIISLGRADAAVKTVAIVKIAKAGMRIRAPSDRKPHGHVCSKSIHVRALTQAG
jgi:hypothetical protein